MKGEYFRQLGVVVEEYCKRYGCSALKDYAKGINIQSVISHSSLKQSHQLMSKIIKSMLKNGAIMENGLFYNDTYNFSFFLTRVAKILIVFID